MTSLFDPMTLRGLTIRNRVWLAPMCQYSVEKRDGVPTDWHLVHLGARAQGGFGLILTEATAVSPEGRISPEDTGLWNDEQRDAWSHITEFVHGQGSAIGVQLAHAGRKASTYRWWEGEPEGTVPPSEGGWEPVGPSAEPGDGLAVPHELTTDEIAQVVRDFADAARRADEAGFDTVEVHAAHGYLLHQFLSPLANHRTDAYGGDLQGRSRIVVEVLDAIRAVWPQDKPVLVRLSGTDWIDGAWDIEQTTALSRTLREHGADLIDVSSGGVTQAAIPIGPGYQVPLAAEVREGAEIPTAAVGLVTEPRQAQEILGAGFADAVLLARAALREPSWPLRAAHELGVGPHDAPYPPAYWRGAWR
ncbi:NADH:flavin oxidoreductase/NADH oxidase [Arsenicicoccus sp. oral taxon 190]|uniref:NADH:flavin oxidoreductase/NADH oxidase n=1 Tax=Arsenicicoccus sp. oral taxon 190 TaxID=1658671 RepID=UPI00067A126E|nr:NADH:flavin oxidoreductase/NADH oxidase [Arsenicicoccus sp. oral taxon 190]AKT50734.1 oxidoreductase [Arsenicicoccus sp. oral taxon 190]